ncbi:MAG: cytochrome-c peroxidase [Geminicoccaceae bacterium]
MNYAHLYGKRISRSILTGAVLFGLAACGGHGDDRDRHSRKPGHHAHAHLTDLKIRTEINRADIKSLNIALGAGLIGVRTPGEAREHGLESLALAVEQDGGVPLPPDLDRFVRDRKAATVLGKALFFDMALGSDGVQACASCHFHAGADNRIKNQLSPALLSVLEQRQGDVIGFSRAAEDPDGIFQLGGPNYTLRREDFPFVRDIGVGANVVKRNGQVRPAPGNSNETASSQGVFLTLFQDVIPGGLVDQGLPQSDPVFNVDGLTTRRVEPRNTPTTVNAVFNFANFWDGRANHRFNGVNPFGPQDLDARIFVVENGQIVPKQIALENGSLASQAVGPPLSHFEMSFGNGDDNARSFPELGRKLLSRRPLAEQAIARDDSLLGWLRHGSGHGLKTSYQELIEKAFTTDLWDSSQWIELPDRSLMKTGVHGVGGELGSASYAGPSAYPRSAGDAFTLTETNFALFYGLAVMLYEATLVADASPFDRWMETGKFTKAFGKDELDGLNVFVGEGKCVNCHGGPEFTNASVRNAQRGQNVIEPMPMGDQRPALYDNGFYNIGVTPTVEDIGRGSNDPWRRPLAFSRQFAFEALEIEEIPFPIEGNPIRNLESRETDQCRGYPTLVFVEEEESLPVCCDNDGDGLCSVGDRLLIERVAVDGAFKTSSLRNVELTGPYMHNGAFATLREVVEFYDRGGNFCRFNCEDLDPDIQVLGLTDDQKHDLVKFLLALSDPRVQISAAPFDHPALTVPNGHPGDEQQVEANPMTPIQAKDNLLAIGAVGAKGGAPIGPFLDADPFSFNAVRSHHEGEAICRPSFDTCIRW